MLLENLVDTLPHQPGPPSPYSFGAHEPVEESSFDFWGIVSRRKWLIFLGLIIGMGLGALYHAQCETIFKSEARVKIEPKKSVFFRVRREGDYVPDMGGGARHDQLINQFNIINSCLSNNKLNTLRCFDQLSEDKIIPYVKKNLEVIQNREEPILYQLVFKSSRPDDAQTILNNLIDTYESDLEAQYSEESQKVATLLKTMHEKFDGEYKELRKKYDVLLTKKGAGIITEQGMNVHEVQVRDIGRLLESAKNKLNEYAADRERGLAALNSGIVEVRAYLWNLKEAKKIVTTGEEKDKSRSNIQTVENTAQIKIRELEIQLKGVMTRYGLGHREVKMLVNEIQQWKEYERELAIEDGSIEEVVEKGYNPEQIVQLYVRRLDHEIADLQDFVRINSELYQENYSEAKRIAGVKAEIESVKENMDQVNNFVSMANARLIELNSREDSTRSGANQEGYNFQILQDATYGEPIWPILPIILGIGALAGSLLGFGLGCLVELADKTFHNPDEIMKQLHVPLIGHVPVIGQSKRYLVENSLIEPIVCTYHRPKSQVSEAFRAVRTALYFNTQGKNHSVIQVTSPTPGDGKSTLASNLAVSIAQSGKRVLLVDADMRRPRQHSTFGISSKEGFATVLSGRSQWRDCMYECEEIEGLTLMPCGAKPYNPAELSSSPQVKDLIEEMRLEFDFIIIDTPPLLAVTDPCPIAARVDGVVLCLRIKKNVRVSAERATEMLANLGAKCIGLVVNGVGAQSGYGSQYTYGAYRAGYSYNGYGYGYGYGYGSGKYYEEDKKGRQAQFAPKHLEARSEQPEQPPVS